MTIKLAYLKVCLCSESFMGKERKVWAAQNMWRAEEAFPMDCNSIHSIEILFRFLLCIVGLTHILIGSLLYTAHWILGTFTSNA